MLKRAFAAVVAVVTAAILVLPAIANPGQQPTVPAAVHVGRPPADPAERGRGEQVAGRGCYPPGRADQARPGCADDGRAVTGPPGRMIGMVQDVEGQPVAGARITCERITATADFEGGFTVVDLVPGTYRCEAVGPPPLKPVSRTVNVAPGQTVDVTLVLR